MEPFFTAQTSLRKGGVGNADAWQVLYITSKPITYNNNKKKELIYFVCNKRGQMPKEEKQ